MSIYQHNALFWQDDQELVDVATPFIQEAIEAGDTTVLACSEHTTNLLTDVIGEHPQVEVVSSVYERPAGAILAYQRIVQRATSRGVSRVRLLGEVDFGSNLRRCQEWVRFDSVVNSVLSTLPLWNLCVYDTRRVDPKVVGAARRTHPSIWGGSGWLASTEFTDPSDYLRSTLLPRPELADSTSPAFESSEIGSILALRHALQSVAVETTALPSQAISDFVYAASEVLTNARLHGEPPFRVRMWASETEIVCAVSDSGPGLDNPLAGYVPPLPSTSGSGLWMARQFTDALDFTREPEGFTVWFSVSG